MFMGFVYLSLCLYGSPNIKISYIAQLDIAMVRKSPPVDQRNPLFAGDD